MITAENIKTELINNDKNLVELQFQEIKEQKFRELLEENKQLKNIIDKAQEFIRDENLLSESDIDYLSELLDSYR